MSDLATLRELTRSGWRLTPCKRFVDVRIPGLSEADTLDVERRLVRHIAPCGCDTAAMALMLVTALGGLYLVARVVLASVRWTDALAVLGAAVVAVVAGKATGILYSHWQLRRTYQTAERSVLAGSAMPASAAEIRGDRRRRGPAADRITADL